MRDEPWTRSRQRELRPAHPDGTALAAPDGTRFALVTAGLLLFAAFMGMAVAYDAELAIPAFAGLAAVLAALLAPARMSMLLLALLAVSYQYVFEDAFTVSGLDLVALHKLAILGLFIPVLLRYGVAWFRLLPMAALAAAFLMTWLWGDPSVSLQDSVKALIGLAAPLLFMLVRWPEGEAKRQLYLVLFLPLMCLAAGAVLQMAGLYRIYMIEFTGAFRLQGASIPAHLAFLAFAALATAILLWKRMPQNRGFLYVMIAANFIILLLTGTRGPLLAAIPLILVFLADLARLLAKGRSALVIPLFAITGLFALAVVWQWDNLLRRSFTRASSAWIDLSGREEAWRFFLERAAESPWFGHGLGSVLTANDGSLYTGFAVPHNEYIRFYHDSGLLGAALLFVSLLAVLLHAAKGLPSGGKVYWAAFVAGFLLYSFTDNTLSTLQFMVPFCLVISAYGRTGTPVSGRKEVPHGENRAVRRPVRQF